ncbi:GntR family transcriptional regulator [Marivita sp. XM-24bin2]|uniref:GntR family transcriptional regulator n=1 Tax=unclassified Marivita TaxID=2632480 RepID=UPI000D7A8DBD|nr:GntR family transcriptional regulator [Marivita sp. XM-24bin2]MCR9110252.1 GntR family transcriptional regulator [Paracoccaceae bacterium]PWL33537.1 MAG: GntR family transcriptional regulator [Marivita sp. XM-24bin2]
MATSGQKKSTSLPLPQLRQQVQPTIADQVFKVLHDRILSLELPPETKISEAEVSAKMGVSRQPVREAFRRLANLGFLQIRPQSGTTVSLISEEAVLRARFIRLALEMHTCRTACDVISDDGLRELSDLIDKQKEAIADNNRSLFHALDDAFHREICVQSGVGYVWDVISENKGHMDRVRMLTLDTSSQNFALNEHIAILKALNARQQDEAAAAIDKHLSRVLVQIEKIKAESHNWFTDITP